MAKENTDQSNPVGRPPVFASASELQIKCNEYFEFIKGNTEEGRAAETPSITGLAYFLGFESRQSIYDYEKNGEFSYTIKRARLKVEASYEQFLLSQSATGAIFALKNFGWRDKSEVDHTTGGEKLDFRPRIVSTDTPTAKDEKDVQL